MKCNKPSARKPRSAAALQPCGCFAAWPEPAPGTHVRPLTGASPVGLRSNLVLTAGQGLSDWEDLSHLIHLYDFTALLPERGRHNKQQFASCASVVASLETGTDPPCPGHGSGLGCPPAAVLEGLPSSIEGPCWPTVLGICPQYPPLQTRMIVITVKVIVIIVTVGVPV